MSTTQVSLPPTIDAAYDSQAQLASNIADDLTWARYTTTSGPSARALSRNQFREEAHTRPLSGVVDIATTLLSSHSGSSSHSRRGGGNNRNRLLFVSGRRSRHQLVSESDSAAAHAELRDICAQRGCALGQDVLKSLGEVGAALAAASASASLLVVKAA